jgi:hypothetical protein
MLDQQLGVLVLLDFLTGTSIADAAQRHGLHSEAEAEGIIRDVLLKNGYAAHEEQRR